MKQLFYLFLTLVVFGVKELQAEEEMVTLKRPNYKEIQKIRGEITMLDAANHLTQLLEFKHGDVASLIPEGKVGSPYSIRIIFFKEEMTRLQENLPEFFPKGTPTRIGIEIQERDDYKVISKPSESILSFPLDKHAYWVWLIEFLPSSPEETKVPFRIIIENEKIYWNSVIWEDVKVQSLSFLQRLADFFGKHTAAVLGFLGVIVGASIGAFSMFLVNRKRISKKG